MKKTVSPPRYRHEAGKTCVDIRLRTAHQLFDGRDPAPFRERDLDEDAVEYILAAFEELPPKDQVKIVFWVAEETSPAIPTETIVDAVHSHFTYEVDRLKRRIRQHVRQGQLALGLGFLFLTLFLTLAEFTRFLPAGTLRQILREGLVITAWVAMWRPLEVLLYDWWPLVRERQTCVRVLTAETTVERGPGTGKEPPGA
jgi:hypothetical protein